MTDSATVPVVIGVADVRWGGADTPASPREPLDLIGEATVAALADTGVPDIGHLVDTIYAVKTASWAYDDLPTLIAERIGAPAPRTWTSSIGGHWPAALLDRIGSEIADGSSRVALVVGGEAQASVKALTKTGTDPAGLGWVSAPGGPPTFGRDDLGSADMQRCGAYTPTRVYPLFENRLGHDMGRSPAESLADSAQLYSAFSELAQKHPVAWSPTARTADDIAGVSPRNRPISDTYPLAMNAMPFVDQAASVVVCSLAAAIDLGVAPERIVYLWGGAGATDTPDVIARSDFGSSPALTSAVERTLTRAGLTADDIGMVDAYSCFPVVPKLLVRALGLPDSVVPSVLGGHSFFGGPLNSYTLHAIAQVTRLLRDRDGDDVALVHANGGYLTYQHIVLLSRRPHPRGYIGDPTPITLTQPAPELVHDYVGDAVIDTATVEYGRSGQPRAGLVVASTPDGRRVAGHIDAGDAALLVAYTAGGTRSLVGAPIHVTDHDGLLSVAVREDAHT